MPFVELHDDEELDQPVPDSRLPVVRGPVAAPVGPALKAGDEFPGGRIGQTGGLEVDVSPGYVELADHEELDKPADMATEFADATKNTAAGLVQGAFSIPDVAANALGGTMAFAAKQGSRAIGSIADYAGLDGDRVRSIGDYAAHNFGNPVTIGGLVEKASPTPDSTSGQAARFGAQFLGGAKNLPGIDGIPAMLGIKSVPRSVLGAAPTEGQAVYQAADRLGMADKLLPADVGGLGTRMATGATNMTLGGIPIGEAAQKSVAAAGGVRDKIAASAGSVMDSADAGRAAQAGAKDFIEQTATKGGKLFEDIPVRGDRMSVLTNTRGALTELTQGMESNPKLSRLVAENPRLKSFLDALSRETKPIIAEMPPGITSGRAGGPVQQVGTAIDGGNLSWQDMKRFRSIIGEIVGQPGLAEDTSTASLRKLYAGLSSDMEATASAEGPKALQAWNRANQYWRGRSDRIENVLNSVLGNDLKKGSQPAFEGIERLANLNGGDSVKLGRMMRSLPKDEADTVRASIIQRMGKAKPGAQDSGTEIFSPAEFATRWESMSKDAQSVLFHDKNLRASLDDLVTVTKGMKAAGKYGNTSKTGLAVNGAALVTALFAHPAIAGAAAGTQFAAGKLLSSPDFARQLARIAKVSPNAPQSVLKNRIAGLSSVAAREPLLAHDIAAVQQNLLRGMNDNAARTGAAAASPDERPNEQ